MLNKSNQKSIELFVDLEKPHDHKSSEEGSSILQMSSHKNDDSKEHKFEKDPLQNKAKKKFLEDIGDTDKSKEVQSKEKDKKLLSKEDSQKFFKKDNNIKIEEDSVPQKKKRGRPRKNKDAPEIPKNKVHVSLQPNSIFPKNKMIKIEGTVKLDLTLFLE
jgi:hypothetical protein